MMFKIVKNRKKQKIYLHEVVIHSADLQEVVIHSTELHEIIVL